MEWLNEEPIKYFQKAKEVLGDPDLFVNKPRGAAIWRPNNEEDTLFEIPSIFEKHMLIDDEIVHMCPTSHGAFFFSYIKVLVSFRQLRDINNLTGAIGYDKISKMMYARSDNLETNIVALKLATDIIMGNAHIGRIRREGLYTSAIEEAVQNPKYAKLAYQSLHDNVVEHLKVIAADEILSSEFVDGYWSGAFNADCTRPSGFASLGRALGLQTGRGKGLDKARAAKGKEQALEKIRKMNLADEKARGKIHLKQGKESVDVTAEMFSSEPWYGEGQPWYASHQPLNWYMGTRRELNYRPHARDAQKAHTQHMMLSNHPYQCVCDSCGHKERFINVDDVMGSYQARPIHDPRFAMGTANPHHNVGSDTRDISRTYGTASQKRDYPKYTDFLKMLQ